MNGDGTLSLSSPILGSFYGIGLSSQGRPKGRQQWREEDAVDGWGTCVIPAHQGWWILWQRVPVSYTPSNPHPKSIFPA